VLLLLLLLLLLGVFCTSSQCSFQVVAGCSYVGKGEKRLHEVVEKKTALS